MYAHTHMHVNAYMCMPVCTDKHACKETFQNMLSYICECMCAYILAYEGGFKHVVSKCVHVCVCVCVVRVHAGAYVCEYARI